MKRYPFENWRSELGLYTAESDELDMAQFGRAARIAAYYAGYFSTTLIGADRIPDDGGALMVSNHGVWGIESPALLSVVHTQTGRVVRPLAEHLMVKLPLIGKLVRSLGAVDGRPENAVRLLKGGHLVLVYPGGHRDALKGTEQSYQLQWQRSRGYLRCAIRAGVPILPVAGVGIDEAFLTLARERWLGRLLFGRADYDLPVTLGLGLIPFPVRFTFSVGEPITLGVGPQAADDEAVLETLHNRVLSLTQALIDRSRSRRFSPCSD